MPNLQQLVRTALQQNYDLREAVARVEAARANLGITRSDQFPQVGVSGDLQFNRLSRDGSFAAAPLVCGFSKSQLGRGVPKPVVLRGGHLGPVAPCD